MMMKILGTIIFWLMIFGIKKFIESKTNIEKEFSLALTFSIVGIIMFLAGILNILNITAIVLILSGLVYFCYSFHKEKKTLISIKKELVKPSVFIPIIIFSYITLVGMNMRFTHYDNFSHWGLIIKNMFVDGALPNFEDTMIMFKGYQPGSACFIYLYGLLAGKTEGSMIIAQNYLVFAYLIPLFKFIKGNNKVLKNILIAVFYLFIMTVSIKFNDLLVDGMISTMAISSLAILFHYRNDLKKGFLYSFPITLFIFLVKNTGFLIGIINCIYMLYLAHKNKNIKQGWKYTIITILVLCATLLIWQGHVKLVFGELALNSKHSLSSDNIILSLRTKGWDKIFQLIKNYALHLFTFKNNITNVYILIINAILLLFAGSTKKKKERKNIVLLTMVVDILYLAYFGVIGGMYLFSMPWEEAIVFAGYERYMTTVIIIIVGIILIYFLGYSEKNYNYQMLMIPSIVLMLATIFVFPSNIKSLIGKDEYKYTAIYKYDLILGDFINKNKEIEYYIYAPSAKNDCGYLFFISKYKLNTGKINMIFDKKDIPYDASGTIIFYDEDKELIDNVKNAGWKNKTEVILEK